MAYSARREALGLEPASVALSARQQRIAAAQQARALAAYAQVQLALAAWQP
jgi:hypothetical protein